MNRPTQQLIEVAVSLETANLLQRIAENEDRTMNFVIGSALDDFAHNYDEFPEEEPMVQPEDYLMLPAGYLGSQIEVRVAEGIHIGYFSEPEYAVDRIRARMEADNFYPNVWYVSDHGNTRLVNLDEEYPT